MQLLKHKYTFAYFIFNSLKIFTVFFSSLFFLFFHVFTSIRLTSACSTNTLNIYHTPTLTHTFIFLHNWSICVSLSHLYKVMEALFLFLLHFLFQHNNIILQHVLSSMFLSLWSLKNVYLSTKDIGD